jgi:hypothetical protein
MGVLFEATDPRGWIVYCMDDRYPSPIGNSLKVVVRIVRPQWAEIVTAHPADKVTQGEV